MATTTTLKWDEVGERLYETGVSKGVIYPYDSSAKKYGTGVAWNGLTSVNENPSGAESTKLWADNIKYLDLMSAEEFGFTIEAYTYPDEFAECDGSAQFGVDGVTVSQQVRKSFGFSYRTEVGNDTEGNDYGYKIHLVYGCKASPSGKDYGTVNDSPEAITLSWEISTTPEIVTAGTNIKPTAHIIIDAKTVGAAILKKIEDKIYGDGSTDPTLPTPDELYALITAA